MDASNMLTLFEMNQYCDRDLLSVCVSKCKGTCEVSTNRYGGPSSISSSTSAFLSDFWLYIQFF